jgi:hypothetical protein
MTATYSSRELAAINKERRIVWYETPPSDWLREVVVTNYSLTESGQTWLNYDTLFMRKVLRESSEGITLMHFDLETRVFLGEYTNVYGATLDDHGYHVRLFKHSNREDCFNYQELSIESERLVLPVEAVLVKSIKVGKPAYRLIRYMHKVTT